ncbi:MAG: 1-phosphofructokinase family hexose kinase [Anaeromassilibacillus sp.]
MRNLGVESTALGFIAGFTGTEIQRLLDACGCRNDFIQVQEGFSRINVKIKAEQESEINGQGPRLSSQNLQDLFSKLENLSDGDGLVLAGSIPNTLPADIYEKILEHLQGRNIHAVVDATGELLRNVLKYQPFLIKPNNHELGELFGQHLTTDEAIISHAQKLQQMGAHNVWFPWRATEPSWWMKAAASTSVCPAGSCGQLGWRGDSMVAGFLAGYLSSQNYETAFQTGLAAGGASAFRNGWPAAMTSGRF